MGALAPLAHRPGSALSASRRASGPRRLLGFAKPLVGLALLALVASTLPWSDVLVWQPEEGEAVSVEGSIEGDWKSDAIAFRADPEASVEPAWPDELREALAAGEPVAVARGRPPAGGAIDWKPSMVRAFADVEPGGLALGFAFFLAGMLCATTRWWRLLLRAGCIATFWNAFRLTFLGLFFNLVVPGLTGGDLVKAVLVVREHPERRHDAFVSVVVDRLIGLMVLVALAAFVIVIGGESFDPALRWSVVGFLALGVGGAAIYVNASLRRLVRFDALVAKLPMGQHVKLVDEAVLLYARHPLELVVAVLLSLTNHALVIAGAIALGAAFGVVGVSVGEWFVVVPVANVVSALPLTPGGWGVGEAAYHQLFEQIGASGALGVAVSVTFRLCQMAMGLAGGLFLLTPGTKAEMHEIEELEVEGAEERPA